MSGGGSRLTLKQAVGRLAGAVRRSPSHGVRSLLYHSIVRTDERDAGQMTTPVALFDDQMRYLAEHGYRVMQAGEVLRRWEAGEPLPARAVSITFDDGFADNLTLALPVLQKYGFPATIFVVAAWVGRAGFLTFSQMRDMIASGLIEFGCHGATHRRLDGLSPAMLETEIAHPKRTLEDELGASMLVFAYPFGSYGTWDSAALGAVRAARFRGAFTSVFGANTPASDRFLLRRSRISWVDRIPEFQHTLAGAYDWYAWRQRLQRPLECV